MGVFNSKVHNGTALVAPSLVFCIISSFFHQKINEKQQKYFKNQLMVCDIVDLRIRHPQDAPMRGMDSLMKFDAKN